MSAFGTIGKYIGAFAVDLATLPYRGTVSEYDDMKKLTPNSILGALTFTVAYEGSALLMGAFSAGFAAVIADEFLPSPILIIGSALSAFYCSVAGLNGLILDDCREPILPQTAPVFAGRKSSAAIPAVS